MEISKVDVRFLQRVACFCSPHRLFFMQTENPADKRLLKTTATTTNILKRKTRTLLIVKTKSQSRSKISASLWIGWSLEQCWSTNANMFHFIGWNRGTFCCFSKFIGPRALSIINKTSGMIIGQIDYPHFTSSCPFLYFFRVKKCKEHPKPIWNSNLTLILTQQMVSVAVQNKTK